MKQTAVEWLVEQLDGERHLTETEINRVIDKAKAMEKEQIIESYCVGCADITVCVLALFPRLMLN